MNNDITKKKWEELHSQSRFRPKYPSELIVQFVFRNFKRNGKEKILDIGCGAGRHIVFMANEGIKAYGTDISRTGIEYTKRLVEHLNLEANLNIAPITDLPYKNQEFDGIISYGVLYYCSIEDIKKAIDEMYRVLKKNGTGLLVVRSIDDYRFGIGKEIEKNTFIIEESNEEKCAYNENSMTMHFFEENEIKKLFSQFSQLTIDKIVQTYNNKQFKDSNFIVYFTK